jgi:hypothetical protein
MNRTEGPRLTAAGTPAKYSPGTLDAGPAHDRVAAERRDPGAQPFGQERQPGDVDAEPGAGHHVIGVDRGALRSVDQEPHAAGRRDGKPRTASGR